MANRINTNDIDNRFMNYCIYYLECKRNIKKTESGTIERKEANDTLKKCVFNILATDDEKLAIGRKNCARTADKKAQIGTAKTLVNAYKKALNGDSSILEKTLKDYLPMIGISNLNAHSVDRCIKDLLAYTNGTRTKADGSLGEAGALSVDKSFIGALIHVFFVRNKAHFEVNYEECTIIRK